MQSNPASVPEDDLKLKLRWLMFLRVLFTSLLLGSTFALQIKQGFPVWGKPLIGLYALIAGLFVLSLAYALLLNHIRFLTAFAYFQILLDTVIVTLIVFMTGNFSSLFTFLYLVVIIYSGMLLHKKGTMVMAACSSIQYGILVDLEFYGVLKPLGMDIDFAASSYDWSYVLYRILIFMVACFVVAFLSGFLAEQAQRSKKELQAMETHVKRVEKMAAVGEMAAGLAHEIRNPLASLSGSIQILKEEVEFDPVHEKLMRIVLRETDRLSSLINNFLLFAKPPAGKMEKIDLEPAITETVSVFEKEYGQQRRFTVYKEISGGVWIEMDPGHLRQILWSLLLNASEAVGENGRIHVRMYPLKENYALIKISDDGKGIPREMFQSIFDPFVTTKPKGTGLGLSIVHRLVEFYDSRLEVDSELGRGAEFTLRLKRVEPPLSTASTGRV